MTKIFKLVRIDNISQINLNEISKKNLRKHYGTGVAITDTSSRREKKYTYRHGVQTNLGDIEKSLWVELCKRVVVRENEQALYKSIRKWVQETSCYETEEELTELALVTYVSEIYDNPEWRCYNEFNSIYRPEILKKKEV